MEKFISFRKCFGEEKCDYLGRIVLLDDWPTRSCLGFSDWTISHHVKQSWCVYHCNRRECSRGNRSFMIRAQSCFRVRRSFCDFVLRRFLLLQFQVLFFLQFRAFICVAVFSNSCGHPCPLCQPFNFAHSYIWWLICVRLRLTSHPPRRPSAPHVCVATATDN